MRRNRGFSLVELLVALVILGLLLGVVLGLTQTSSRLEKGQRALALLAEDLSLTATVLAREIYLAGYRVDNGTLLYVESHHFILRFFCEEGMNIYCPDSMMNKVRTIMYSFNKSGTLLWGACEGATCTPSATHPVLGGVVRFGVAYRTQGVWSRQSLTVQGSNHGVSPQVEAMAVYILAQSPLRTGSGSFTPGSTVSWASIPDGQELRSLLNLPLSLKSEGKPMAERLVVAQTPNLMR
ncbi:prepilin-type N-terminal cleavage/methylation domain-containing protein [Thermus sp.]|uniref:prepilin-type N-terminal cleavage/methylation domain-containing protein n=1 Tax=Thermus sp. TaxID=275 RepID=UPI00391A4DFD